VVIDIVHQLLNFLLIPHLTDETTPSSPVNNPHLILHRVRQPPQSSHILVKQSD